MGKARCSTCDANATPLVDEALDARICRDCAAMIATREWKCISCCARPVNQGMLYCGDYCQMVSEKVKYERRKVSSGEFLADDLVRRAIKIGRAWVASGEAYRNDLPSETKLEVFALKGRACAVCGATRDIQIDHIDGRSNDITNLQPLCRDCHDEKTLRSIWSIGPEHPDFPAVTARMEAYKARVDADPPLRPCDDEVRWPRAWQSVVSFRRKLLRASKERFEQSVRDYLAELDDALRAKRGVGG